MSETAAPSNDPLRGTAARAAAGTAMEWVRVYDRFQALVRAEIALEQWSYDHDAGVVLIPSEDVSGLLVEWLPLTQAVSTARSALELTRRVYVLGQVQRRAETESGQ